VPPLTRSWLAHPYTTHTVRKLWLGQRRESFRPTGARGNLPTIRSAYLQLEESRQLGQLGLHKLLLAAPARDGCTQYLDSAVLFLYGGGTLDDERGPRSSARVHFLPPFPPVAVIFPSQSPNRQNLSPATIIISGHLRNFWTSILPSNHQPC